MGGTGPSADARWDTGLRASDIVVVQWIFFETMDVHLRESRFIQHGPRLLLAPDSAQTHAVQR
jgi:hypothetical protein